MDFITYKATLPEVPAGTDVVSQEFTVEANGSSVLTETITVGGTPSNFEVPQDSNVTATLVYIDDAGNRSEARVLAFVATDAFAPAEPGEISVEAVSERTAPDA